VKVFFLSDLHLESGTSGPALRFARFLLEEPRRGDIVILGGDIFDLLVGSKAVFWERFSGIFNALKDAGSRGVRVHYLEGNHDFHFSPIFAGHSNIVVYTADFEISTNLRHRLWVSHGDLIDSEDAGYRFLRAFTKNAVFRTFLLALPGKFVDFIGSSSSGASRKYSTGRAENEGTGRLRKLYLEFARSKVREGYRHVLVGHSHLFDHIAIEAGSERGEYLNLGFSPDLLRFGVLLEGSERFEIRERH
jgi:UDP-2,3-diacylglucosamine hydrolase